jgi:indole-3-glycerol phosphate synthase
MTATLDQILAARRRSVADVKAGADMANLRRRAESAIPLGFRRALEQKSGAGEIAVIAELKKASPSRGLIRADFDVEQLAAGFAHAGAAALSVLTEEQHFQGSLQDLQLASEVSGLPCLRKDFIVDEFQILEARAAGASAILLIVAALTTAELERLRDAARGQALDILCEVHDDEELKIALDLGFDIIGVNNRNLRTFEVDLGTSLRLAHRISPGVLKVAESGIYSGDDVRRLRDASYDAFLVGESLMKASNPAQALAGLITSSKSSAAVPR